ncbi:MAG: winged helix-turn-helix transcriptional regulator [Albidovulum sp.]
MLDEDFAPDPVDAALMAGNVLSELCPSRTILRQVTTRWSVLCLIVLNKGEMRFSDLRRTIGGVSERMLSKTLQDLAGHGLVHRESFPVVPPHVVYSLTPLGREMAAQVSLLTVWIEENIDRFPAEAVASP